MDEYGLDSLSAMRIAGRLVKEFDLLVPLSPFMFLSEPTLHGMCKVVISCAPDGTSEGVGGRQGERCWTGSATVQALLRSTVDSTHSQHGYLRLQRRARRPMLLLPYRASWASAALFPVLALLNSPSLR